MRRAKENIELIYPILAAIFFFSFWYFIIPWYNGLQTGIGYPTSVRDRLVSATQWMIMWEGPWLLWYAKKRMSRAIQVIAVLFLIQGYFLNVCGFKYDSIHGSEEPSGPDQMASNSFGPFISDSHDRGIIPSWNPYIFCGMPTHGSLQATALSQAQGIAKKCGMYDAISVMFLLGISYLLMRWRRTSFEDRILRKIRQDISAIDQMHGDGTSVVIFFAIFLTATEIIIPICFMASLLRTL